MPITINIIGCGIIGATIAYELSCLDKFKIAVYDAQQPAQASTGAALGVLMGIISQKVKGRAWHLREISIRRYYDLIPELERTTGLKIPHNRQGIVKLLPPTADLTRWQQLVTTRTQQQWQLELWDKEQISAQLPQVNLQCVGAAVYSPQDLQVDPVALTNALVAAAKLNGVKFHFDRQIDSISANSQLSCELLTTDRQTLTSDWVIVTAGLGASKLVAPLAPEIEIDPVLGQAIQFRFPQPLGRLDFQPVLNYEDVQIVPIEQNEYWIGATVEFPVDGTVVAQAECLARMQQLAIDVCPDLAQGKIVRTWSGLRPRPHQRPAPIIERLAHRVGEPGRVVVAAGHYRNGVLLAPATARIVGEILDG
jgi:glycine oxidase